MAAYNFARRLKTLNGLTPYEYICKIWTSEPDRFILNPIHQMPGLNTRALQRLQTSNLGDALLFPLGKKGLQVFRSERLGQEGVHPGCTAFFDVFHLNAC